MRRSKSFNFVEGIRNSVNRARDYLPFIIQFRLEKIMVCFFSVLGKACKDTEDSVIRHVYTVHLCIVK